jgi:hypothetical protein
MRCRSAYLNLTSLVLAALLTFAAEVRAHRLKVRCRVLPGKNIQVSARYQTIPKSTPAPEARVQVFGPGRRPLTEGQTDADGMFVFSFTRVEPLQIEVYQDGHLGKDEITVAALRESPADSSPSPGQASPAPSLAKRKPNDSRAPAGDPEDGDDWQELLKNLAIGVSLILALTALFISLRTARQVRGWKKTAS